MARGPRPAAALLALGFGLVTVAVLVRDPLPGEVRLLRTVHVEDEGWRRLLEAVSDATDLGPLVLVAAVGLGVLVAARRRSDAVLLVAVCAVVWAINPVIKDLVARPRPDLWSLPADVSEHAFPSGHAANTAALVGAALAVLAVGLSGRARVVALGVGAMVLLVVAGAQLALGRHWPSDVLAGWLWAGACLAVVLSVRARRPAGRH